jgi:hypothetical protein
MLYLEAQARFEKQVAGKYVLAQKGIVVSQLCSYVAT